MRVVYERCCGLDVHKKTVVACVMTPEGQETRTFGTLTQELLALAEWLEQWGVTQVAMESPGVYWKPWFNLLEGTFEVLVVNTHHISPGVHTQVNRQLQPCFRFISSHFSTAFSDELHWLPHPEPPPYQGHRFQN
jgi:transposase